MRGGGRARAVRRAAACLALVAASGVLAGCGGSKAPTPSVPFETYAGAPTGDPATTTAGSTSPSASAPPTTDEAPQGNPAIDDVVQFAAINGSEITGDWQGGCRTTPSVGVAGMTWYGSDLRVAGGGALRELRIEVSISGSAADGRPNVDLWSVAGSFDDGRAFESSWAPWSRGSLLDVSASDGVLVFGYEAESPVRSFDLQVYCD